MTGFRPKSADPDSMPEIEEPDNACPFIAGCSMFPYFKSKGAMGLFKIHYCHSEYQSCARYERASCGSMPHPSLLPDGSMIRKP